MLNPFHWKFSSVFGVGCWFAGVSAMMADKYVAALIFYAVGGLWLLGWWLTENPMPKRREGQQQWNKNQLKKIRKRWLGALVPLGITSVMCIWTLNLKEQFELSKLDGWLVPDSSVSPPDPCDIPQHHRDPKALTIFWGDQAASEEMIFPHTILEIHGEPKVVLEKNDKGELAITLDVFDENGNIVASIEHNQFTVNPNNYFRKIQQNKSSLIVISQKKEKVLDIHYLNASAIKILGIFRYPGIPPIESSDDGLSMFGNTFTGGTCIGYSGKPEFVAN